VFGGPESTGVFVCVWLVQELSKSANAATAENKNRRAGVMPFENSRCAKSVKAKYSTRTLRQAGRVSMEICLGSALE
jgi:hypothetical protein